MTADRVYFVQVNPDMQAARRLVRAPNSARVSRHVMTGLLSIQVASQIDLIRCTKAGIEVENCSNEPEPDANRAAAPEPDDDAPAAPPPASTSSANAADLGDARPPSIAAPATTPPASAPASTAPEKAKRGAKASNSATA